MAECKACVTCAHIRFGDYKFTCKLTLDAKHAVPNPVDGTVNYSRAQLCDVERSERNAAVRYIMADVIGLHVRERCGPEGKYWEEAKVDRLNPPVNAPVRRHG